MGFPLDHEAAGQGDRYFWLLTFIVYSLFWETDHMYLILIGLFKKYSFFFFFKVCCLSPCVVFPRVGWLYSLKNTTSFDNKKRYGKVGFGIWKFNLRKATFWEQICSLNTVRLPCDAWKSITPLERKSNFLVGLWEWGKGLVHSLVGWLPVWVNSLRTK